MINNQIVTEDFGGAIERPYLLRCKLFIESMFLSFNSWGIFLLSIQKILHWHGFFTVYNKRQNEFYIFSISTSFLPVYPILISQPSIYIYSK